MKLNRIWIVRDPSDVSELADILFETTATGMANYVIGTGATRWEKEHHAIYTTYGEARRDALERLAQEKKPASPYRPSPDQEEFYAYDRRGEKRRVTIPGR